MRHMGCTCSVFLIRMGAQASAEPHMAAECFGLCTAVHACLEGVLRVVLVPAAAGGSKSYLFKSTGRRWVEGCL